MSDPSINPKCCIVGGGPAGVMLGYLLARAGVPVTVLEKHADFNRDFRGDTVHPSTLEVLHELDLLDGFLRLPHQRITSVGGVFGDFRFQAADNTHLPTRCRFVALTPQWDFLQFLSEQGKKFPAFDLRLEHLADDLLWERGRVAGVVVRTPHGMEQIRADLVIGCDGRHSITRTVGGFEVLERGVPIDVLWFRISRQGNDPEQVLGNINYGRVLILINRHDYFQAGLIVRKGSFESLKQKGMEAFRGAIVKIAPFLEGRVDELQDWNQISLLSVQINRLKQWSRPGLLCIGDAAHAMSPAFGVGINLAIQDAVATANLLAQPLLTEKNVDHLLHKIQDRRELPTRLTQFLQARAHQGFQYVFRHEGPIQAPWQLKAALQIPGIQRLTARIIGLGFCPEHVHKEGMPARRKGIKIAQAVGVAAGVAAGLTVLWLGLRRQRATRHAT
jgi:2-polyprenyl-6-methoxyphenol hydroxylase-like FAD-dependent oxidoreductase